ncbi:MAG: histidinol dehydrogenase [Candidatus Limnocylindrales bacterium]
MTGTTSANPNVAAAASRDATAGTPGTPGTPGTSASAGDVAFRLRRLDLAAAAAGDAEARSLRNALIRRGAVPDDTIREQARSTLAAVRAAGDDAVRVANATVGGGRRDGRLVLEPSEMRDARDRLEPRIRRALDQAIDNVRRFAEPQRPRSTTVVVAPGIEIERRWAPLARVGAYVPGGSAPYPSSLVMTVVPAQVAGVDQVVVASPADRDGRTTPILLGAAGLLDVDAFVVAGGAQAIGALAYGLPGAGVAPVDRIVGPGNAWVTAAKIEVCGEVGIDLPAGPSEGMVLAAPSTGRRPGTVDVDPARIAADLITQAEHGPASPAILVTTDVAFAEAVETAVAAALAVADRRAILAAALRDHGLIALAPSLDAAVDFINAYGPEHLSVDVEPLEPTVARLRNAGSIFVGPWAPESAGDYATGANHVLPTGGLARGSGGLAVETYGKFVQVQRITRDGLAGIRETVGRLAEAEGLMAHRNAVEIRFRDER